jgi:hypothetical protein
MAEIPRTADGLLRMMMTDFQKHFDATIDPKSSGLKLDHVAQTVNLYGQIYLLGAVRHFAPDDADHVAAELANAWEAGDSLGEWVYQWRQELESGQPLTIPLVTCDEVGS